MEKSDWNLKELTNRLLERVRARGLAPNSVIGYRTACNGILKFAKASGDTEWSPNLAERYLEHLDRRVAEGSMCPRHRLHHQRVVRLLGSLAETGEADFSAAAGGPRKYLVDARTAGAVEAMLEDAGLSEEVKGRLRAAVRHLLWYAAERDVRPLEIDDALVMRFLVEEAPRTNGGSAGLVLRCVKLATEWLGGHGGRIARDYSMPTLKDGKRTIVPAFSEAEIGAVVGSIDTSTALGKRDLAIILLAYCTGLRGADIRKLKLSDIDWRGRKATVSQSKTHAPITCALNGETMNALADYVLEARPDCGAPEVFVTATAPHRAIAPGLNGMLDKRCAAAGVEKVPMRAFRSLRRSFETVMVSRGTPIETASQMMGHARIAEDKPYITHDEATMALVAMGFGDVPVTAGAYAPAAEGGDAS